MKPSNVTTARNFVDLILFITILVLLTIAAPVLRGFYDGGRSSESKYECHPQASCVTAADNKTSTCECHEGFKGDGHSCHDVDECRVANLCPSNAQCINVVGSYTCECYRGYHGEECVDIDECAVGANPCNKHADCINTPGSYECSCHPGFFKNRTSCQDIDECKAGSVNCSEHAQCKNTVGSYTCTCETGFLGDGLSCADVDECKAGTYQCNSHGICQNTIGSYTCSCLPGFSGDGRHSCSDIDECSEGSFCCGPDHDCTNTEGSYTCNQKSGYHGNEKLCQGSGQTFMGATWFVIMASLTLTLSSIIRITW